MLLFLLNKSNIYERNWFEFDQEHFLFDNFSSDWEDLLKINELNNNNSTQIYFLVRLRC